MTSQVSGMVEGDILKIRKSFLWFGIGLILLSVVSAVYAYDPSLTVS